MSLTEDEYRDFVQLRIRFVQELITAAHEICRISKGRDLVGEWDEEVYDDVGVYRICFECDDVCGDMSTDCVDVPVEYVYDKEYRIYYKGVLEERRRVWERKMAKNKVRREAYTYLVGPNTSFTILEI